MLPFVIAAKSGDQGAERELLIRLTPVVLEVARGAYGLGDPEIHKLAAETLVATLKALPTFRGDESISEAVACATVNAARTFEVFRDRGTLNVGAPADVAILELREGEFEFLDNYENKIKGRQRLFPTEDTVLGGVRVDFKRASPVLGPPLA